MADRVDIKVEGSAYSTYPKLDEVLRAKLRALIPFLTKRLAERVRAKLVPGVLFKTTTRLLPSIKVKMVENSKELYGTVYSDPNMFPAAAAASLEKGSVAHEIAGNPYLAFYWAKLGRNVVFRRVHHPGYPGKSYMQSSLDEENETMKQRVKNAVGLAVKNPDGT